MQKLLDLKEKGEAAVAACESVPLITTEVRPSYSFKL